MPEHGLKPEKQFQIMWSLHAIYIIMFVRLLFELFFFLHPEYILKTFTLIPKTGRHYKKITNTNTDKEILNKI